MGSLHKPPDTDINLFNAELSELFESTRFTSYLLTVLAGDFNIDLIKSNNHSPTQDFLNTLLSYSFLPSIQNPTRVTESSATLIDNIFYDSSSCRIKSAVVYSDISDHFPVVIHINISPFTGKKTEISSRSFRVKEIMKFNNDLNQIDWNECFQAEIVDKDPDVIYNKFSETYCDLYHKNFGSPNEISAPLRSVGDSAAEIIRFGSNLFARLASLNSQCNPCTCRL